jgi:hypothetical protein
VAVLCNTTGTNPSAMAHGVADIVLGDRLREPAAPTTVEVPEAVLRERAGVYRDRASGAVLEVVVTKDGLRAYGASGPRLLPLGPTRFATEGRTTYTFEAEPGDGGNLRRLVEATGSTRPTVWERVQTIAPDAAALAEYAGRYYSPELEVSYQVAVDGGTLGFGRSNLKRQEAKPLDRDAFQVDGNVVQFTRDAAGKVDGFEVYAGRVWHLRFDRQAP